MEDNKQRAVAEQRRGTYMAEFGLSDEHVGARLPSEGTPLPREQQDALVESPSETLIQSMDPVEMARTEVRLAEARFSHRVRRVSDVSELAVRDAWTSTRPVLLGVTLIGAASATLALVAAVRTFRRRAPVLIRHEEASQRKSSVLRSVLMSIGLLVVRRVAERALDKLQAHQAEQDDPFNTVVDDGDFSSEQARI